VQYGAGFSAGAVLQHRQLHMLFTSILSTAILPTLHYACPTLPYVLLDCSVDGVSPPSGAIRNLRPIL